MGDLEPPAPKPGDVLVDSRGSAHIISRPLGAAPSGYGKLWLTTDPTILVKIMKSHPPDLSAVDLLGLPMAQPLALLEPPYRGQILELKSGTLEVEELMASPSPAKQLAILRRTAEVLAVLHSAGWVFGDLNPRNILAWPDAEEVVLVDLDTLAENRVAFGKSSSAHIKRARVLGLVPPWGLPGSAAQIDDTFVLVGFVGQAGGTRPELEVISPNTAVVVDEVARLINRPSTDTPSMGTLWAAMCMDEDRRRRCPLCGCLHCHSDSCPNCQYSSPATLIKFTSKSDN